MENKVLVPHPYPIIRSWTLMFLKRVPRPERDRLKEEIYSFAKSPSRCNNLDIVPSYSISGELFGGNFPDGHIVVTHEISQFERVVDETAIRKVVDIKEWQTVLIAKTVRNEKFYLAVDRYSPICAG